MAAHSVIFGISQKPLGGKSGDRAVNVQNEMSVKI